MKNNIMTYFEMYGVHPDEYSEIDISSLGLTNGLSVKLKQNEFNTVEKILRASRSDIQALRGIGEKQISNIERGLEIFLSSYWKLNYNNNVNKDTVNKDIAKIILTNKEKIISGDFSFKIGMPQDIVNIIEKYEYAYNELGSETVLDIADDTNKYKNISKYLTCISKEYNVFSACRNNAFKCLNLIPEEYLNKPAYGFILAVLTKDDAEILLKIADMKKVKLCSLPYLLNMDMVQEANLIAKMYTNCNFNLLNSINRIMSELQSNERQKVILNMRANGFTLDQIGQQCGKTRERIRQIEARARKKFEHWDSTNKIILKISALLNSKSVIESKDIVSVLKNSEEELIYLLKNSGRYYYKYFSDIDSFIIDDNGDLDKALLIAESLPDLIENNEVLLISQKVYEEHGIAEDIFKAAINLTYKSSGKMFYKNKLTAANIYLYTIEKYYPDGIFLYDKDIIEGFRKRIYDQFGEVSIAENDRALRARVIDNCIMCDKGKYMAKKKSYVPDELLYEMFSYIENEEKSVIMLNSIFVQFEEQLHINGINNRYFLQGILKKYLSDKYSFTRDYLFKDKKIKSFYNEVINYISKFDYPITKKQINDAFPGITEIVFNYSVGDENIVNFFGEYLHGSKLNLNEEDINYLLNIVNSMLNDRKPHHSKELFEVISLKNSHLLNKVGIFHAYSLFSVVAYLFRNEFQFSRPYFALNDVNIGKPTEILSEWVKSQDIVDISDITGYAKEMRYLVDNILELMNSYNESHLLINSTSIASFETIGIDEIIAADVENIVFSELKGTCLISDLNCIGRLPKLNFPWTDWLIYSVLLKWGTKTEVAVTNKYFKYAQPVVAKKGDIDLSVIEFSNISKVENSEYKIDNLDDIDDLISDIIDEELFWELL